MKERQIIFYLFILILFISTPCQLMAESNIILTMPPILAASKDRLPDQFSFDTITDVDRNVFVKSNIVTITGIDIPVSISITNGSYSINGGSFTSISGTIINGQKIQLRVMSSGSYSTSTIATIKIGKAERKFKVTTLRIPDDPIPNPFNFNAKTNVARNIFSISNTVSVTGINVPTSISIIGGSYSVDGGSFTNVLGTIKNNQTVRVRIKSSTNFSTTTSATLTIGGVNGVFKVTTLPPTTILANHTSYIDSINYFNIVGEFRNNTSTHLRFVKISGNLFDSNDQLIDTDFTYTYLDNIPPGEKTCFELSFQNSRGASYYEFEEPTYWTDGNPLPDLTVNNVSGTYDSTFGWYDILGMVRNDSSSTVTYVMPVGTVYNSSGKATGCDFTFVNSTDLDPGQSSAFELNFIGRDYNDVYSYRIQVDGN